jgi:hypothetical protein
MWRETGWLSDQSLAKSVESVQLKKTPVLPPPVVKMGKEGKPIPATANIIRLIDYRTPMILKFETVSYETYIGNS